jgi:hypothetical protein
METLISTREVCRRLALNESTLRHALRRPGAPRPRLHPSARLFLWSEGDVAALARFLDREHHAVPPGDSRAAVHSATSA